jgi:hypothetical protein
MRDVGRSHARRRARGAAAPPRPLRKCARRRAGRLQRRADPASGAAVPTSREARSAPTQCYVRRPRKRIVLVATGLAVLLAVGGVFTGLRQNADELSGDRAAIRHRFGAPTQIIAAKRAWVYDRVLPPRASGSCVRSRVVVFDRAWRVRDNQTSTFCNQLDLGGPDLYPQCIGRDGTVVTGPRPRKRPIHRRSCS